MCILVMSGCRASLGQKQSGADAHALPFLLAVNRAFVTHASAATINHHRRFRPGCLNFRGESVRSAVYTYVRYVVEVKRLGTRLASASLFVSSRGAMMAGSPGTLGSSVTTPLCSNAMKMPQSGCGSHSLDASGRAA
jgi:hypothetical protein